MDTQTRDRRAKSRHTSKWLGGCYLVVFWRLMEIVFIFPQIFSRLFHKYGNSSERGSCRAEVAIVFQRYTIPRHSVRLLLEQGTSGHAANCAILNNNTWRDFWMLFSNIALRVNKEKLQVLDLLRLKSHNSPFNSVECSFRSNIVLHLSSSLLPPLSESR